MGEGPRGSNGTCSTLCWFSVTPSTTHNQIGPLWCWFPSGGAFACSRPLWVSPRNSPVRLGVSPASASTPTGIFNQWFEALFPCTGALGCAVSFAPPTIPPSLSMRECAAEGSASGRTACPVRSTVCHVSGSGWGNVSPLPRLPISAPPMCLDECFFFISLVVGLPCSSIFCQFW